MIVVRRRPPQGYLRLVVVEAEELIIKKRGKALHFPAVYIISDIVRDKIENVSFIT